MPGSCSPLGRTRTNSTHAVSRPSCLLLAMATLVRPLGLLPQLLIVDLIRDFVAAGASINARALHGFTALHFGVLSLRPATVSLLLSLGADAKAPLYTTIYELYPPLIYSNWPLIRLNCLQGLIYFVSVCTSQWRLRSLTRVRSQPRVLRPLTAIDFQLARLLVTAGAFPDSLAFAR